MKRIKNVKELQVEKDRVKDHLVELESKIKTDWKELKASINPFHCLKEAFYKGFFLKSEDGTQSGGEAKTTWAKITSVIIGRVINGVKENLTKMFKQRNKESA